MAKILKARDLQYAVKRGFDRMQFYRRARAMFIKAFVGHYYANKYGLTGTEPINLLFNAIRVMVPNLIMQNPVVAVTTDYPDQKNYAELLGLGVTKVFETTDIMWPLRAEIVDSMFGFGIFKTALRESGSFVAIDDNLIDPGQVYNALVNLDNFTFDPSCTSPLFRNAAFTGDAVVVPREYLMKMRGINKDLVKKLASLDSDVEKNDRIENISEAFRFGREFISARDLVRIVQVWVPEANAYVLIPDPRVETFDDYLRIVDYYGPDDGPYSYLSFTPPVPDNPFPVAPVGIWFDLHVSANNVMRKLLDQINRQKDITVYKPELADEAQELKDAEDGDTVASSDPAGIQVVSYGGGNAKNEVVMGQLMSWFSYMAGNVDQMGGQRAAADTATGQQILEANSTVTIDDCRTITYNHVGTLARKTAWYLHTDPLIDLPLTKRKNNEDIPVKLTPEQRSGEFLSYTFKIRPKTLARLDPAVRSRRMIEFATNVVPAAAMAGQQLMQMGFAFDASKFIQGVGEELDLGDFISDVFNDPNYAARLALMQSFNPPDVGGKSSAISQKGILQNKGLPNRIATQTPTQPMNAAPQMTAAASQSAMAGKGIS